MRKRVSQCRKRWMIWKKRFKFWGVKPQTFVYIFFGTQIWWIKNDLLWFRIRQRKASAQRQSATIWTHFQLSMTDIAIILSLIRQTHTQAQIRALKKELSESQTENEVLKQRIQSAQSDATENVTFLLFRIFGLCLIHFIYVGIGDSQRWNAAIESWVFGQYRFHRMSALSIQWWHYKTTQNTLTHCHHCTIVTLSHIQSILRSAKCKQTQSDITSLPSSHHCRVSKILAQTSKNRVWLHWEY